MKTRKSLILLFAFIFITGNVVAGETNSLKEGAQNKLLPDSVVNTWSSSNTMNGFDPRFMKKANLSCGLPPLPPLGCTVGSCVCDQNGNNCQWTFICN